MSICTNCNTKLTGKFCSECGQKKFSPHDLTISKFILNFFEDFFKFDSNIFRTIRSLLFKPGFLSSEYMNGRIASYVKPLKLFVFTCIIVFFLGPYVSKEDYTFPINDFNFFDAKIEQLTVEKNITRDAFIEKFNANYISKLPFYFLMVVIVFTLVLSLLFIRQKKVIAAHLIFSLHFYTACLIFSLMESLFDQLDDFSHYIFFSIFPLIYLFLSIKVFYKKNNLQAILPTIFLFIVYFVIQYYWMILTGYITLRII